MSKQSTKEIQNSLINLGEKLGFVAKMEERLHGCDIYAPRYDVVWYLELGKVFNLNNLKELFKNDLSLFNKIKYLPFAGFEIEGANTSSKNQIGNFANLYCGDFVFNFVIVNNYGANNEEDTYRRGIKIAHYFKDHSGDSSVIFMDSIHLKKSIEQLNDYNKGIDLSDDFATRQKGSGGETKSLSALKGIEHLIKGTGMSVKFDYSPSKDMDKIKFMAMKEFHNDSLPAKIYSRQSYRDNPYISDYKVAKKVSDSFYIPKLDVVLGFNSPNGFNSWLRVISDTVGDDSVHFPILYGIKKKFINQIFIPLISIEIETSNSKHANGGIYNMSKNSFIGVILADEEVKRHLEFFRKELGVKNVTYYEL